MAINGLPDVSFSNNLGTISFKRCLVGISDTWQWDGRSVKHYKQVQLNGYIQQQVIPNLTEGFEPALTSQSGILSGRGAIGSLTLPWTVLNNVKLSNIDLPVGTWIDFEPVSAQFTDERPDDNIYTLTFFDFILHNPRINVNLPSRTMRDEYAQLPWYQSGEMNPLNPQQHVMRTRTGYEMMSVQLTGSIVLPDGKLPVNLIKILTHRIQETVNTMLPAGYPEPFHLGVAIPELANDLNLANMIINDTRASWIVEEDRIQLSINMICQPQRIEETDNEGGA